MSLIVSFVIGVGFGLIYQSLLRRNAQLYLQPETRLWGVLMHLARLGAAVALFVALLGMGRAALAAGVAGFVIIRVIVVRRQAREIMERWR